MYINSGYLNNSHLDFKDRTRPLIVGSCGTYRLSSHPKMPTYRPKGRKDFQIIYIASGLVHFHFDKPEDSRPSSLLGTSYSTVPRRNCKSMSFMEKTKQKFTGYTLPAAK